MRSEGDHFDELAIRLFMLVARYGILFADFIPWGRIKQWVNSSELDVETLYDHRFGFTFDQICEFTSHGFLKMHHFTTMDIISLLERDLINERTSIDATGSARGDDSLQSLKRRYLQDPTKARLLSYAMACVRHAAEPTVDFCLASPRIEPFFDPARDLPQSKL